MMKSSCAIAGVFLICTVALSAQPASRPLPAALTEKVRAQYGLSAAEAEDIGADGEITRFQDGNFTSLLLPDKRIAAEISAEMKALEPLVIVEALFVIPAVSAASPEDTRLRIYNILRSIGTMKGIEYYSASRERMRVMFHDAYVVKDGESRKALPDPLVTEIPRDSTIYVYQHDSSFGKNNYETRYLYDGETFRTAMKNLTVMYYGILPVVQPENLRLELVVLPADDHILFYGCIGVDTYSMFGLEKKTHASFLNRIKALFDWFARRF